MGRKSNKQRIKEQLDEALTIQQLIDHLKTMPPGTYVGKAGHFGEANLMDKYALPTIREVYITPSGNWRDNKEHIIEMLDLHVPDIGPDPD
jgi:hypothetical protein